jgi:hypothetical protein
MMKWLSFILILGTLVGGVFLVRKNQETRRGAAGENMTVNFSGSGAAVGGTASVIVSLAAADKKVVGADLKIKFSKEVLEYTGLEIYKDEVAPRISGLNKPFMRGDNNLLKPGATETATINSSGLINVVGISQKYSVDGSGAPIDGETGENENSLSMGNINVVRLNFRVKSGGTATVNLDSDVNNKSMVATFDSEAGLEAVSTGWQAIITSTGCTSNENCADDKTCLANKCEVPVCPMTVPECKKSVYKNHVCGLENLASGSVCSTTGILGENSNGQCLLGTCVAVTVTPVETLIPGPEECLVCPTGMVDKTKGNADCNNIVDLSDFSAWRKEYFDEGAKGTIEKDDWSANFNCPTDKKTDLVDFTTWLTNCFGEEGGCKL